MRKSTGGRIDSYRDLETWRLAMEIVVEIYRITREFPPEEKFGLIAQVRRAAVSIPSNIAEGHSRLGTAEFRRFVSIARGSLGELETQIAVTVALRVVRAGDIASLISKLDQLSKMLFGLYRSLGERRGRGDDARRTADG